MGDEKIVIAALPKALKQNPRTVNCKSYVLGEFYHINKGPSKIVKVLWHPLSKGFTDILVMTQDGILRYENWSLWNSTQKPLYSPDDPSNTFYL